MPRVRIMTEGLNERIRKIDKILCEWMHKKNYSETDPEGCIDLLVNEGIYKFDSHGRAHYFREDLRTLRDCGKIDIFENLKIEQKTRGAKWYIRLIG